MAYFHAVGAPVEGDIGELQRDVANLKTSVTQHTSNISNINTSIEKINGDIKTLTDDISELGTNVNTNSSDITTLKSRAEEITTQLGTLNSSVSQLNTKTDNLQSSVNTLSAKIGETYTGTIVAGQTSKSISVPILKTTSYIDLYFENESTLTPTSVVANTSNKTVTVNIEAKDTNVNFAIIVKG